MMTTTIINEVTKSDSDRHKECRGQGFANMVSGFMGGMAGCVMIGQTFINVSSGARTRLSTLIAGIFLLCLVIFLKDWLAYIPIAALVSIMIMVAFTTFNWDSVKNFSKHPKQSNIVMLTTVMIVLATHNLVLGVFVGVLLSALFLVNKLESEVKVQAKLLDQHTRIYHIKGQICFSSADKFYYFFNFNENIQHVINDLTEEHVWDITSVAMLKNVQNKFKEHGIDVDLIGLNQASTTLIDQFS